MRRAQLLLLAASTILSLYLLQAGLLANASRARALPSLSERARELGLPYDTRRPIEVYEQFKPKDREISLNFGPAFVPPEGLPGDQGAIFPLGGMSRRRAIGSNEFGTYPILPLDEHGFNNPTGLYREGLELALIGDSFVESADVERGRDIPSLLRRDRPRTLGFGRSGIGALAELGILTEYAQPLRPKAVVWFYFGNDVSNDIPRERQSPILRRYLERGFSQRLMTRQAEVDRAWAWFFDHSDPSKTKLPGALPEPSPLPRQRAVRFLGLYYLRTFLLSRYPLSERDRESVSLFKDIMAEAKARVESWGGRLYFVYLPEINHFRDPRRADRCREDVLRVARGLGLPVIDVYEAFKKEPDPLELFYIRQSVHYNAEGKAVVAKAVEDGIRKF